MIAWLKYAGSKEWYRVTVLGRLAGHSYRVSRSRTEFTVGPRDTLIVVKPTPAE